jgi:hypothetical protein
MLLGLTVAVALSITVAILLARVSPLESPSEISDARRIGEPGTSGRCVMCNAPLPRSATLDELIAEAERRIDSDVAALPRMFSRGHPSANASGPSRS